MHQTIEELKLGTYENIATVCKLSCLCQLFSSLLYFFSTVFCDIIITVSMVGKCRLMIIIPRQLNDDL